MWEETMNKWETCLDYFLYGQRHYGCNFINRKIYLQHLSRFNIGPVTCDNNRCILMTAGYLARIKLGVYKLTAKRIPANLTYSQARREAYG